MTAMKRCWQDANERGFHKRCRYMGQNNSSGTRSPSTIRARSISPSSSIDEILINVLLAMIFTQLTIEFFFQKEKRNYLRRIFTCFYTVFFQVLFNMTHSHIRQSSPFGIIAEKTNIFTVINQSLSSKFILKISTQ